MYPFVPKKLLEDPRLLLSFQQKLSSRLKNHSARNKGQFPNYDLRNKIRKWRKIVKNLCMMCQWVTFWEFLLFITLRWIKCILQVLHLFLSYFSENTYRFIISQKFNQNQMTYVLVKCMVRASTKSKWRQLLLSPRILLHRRVLCQIKRSLPSFQRGFFFVVAKIVQVPISW